MKLAFAFLSLVMVSVANAGEVNEPSYVGHISCALENSKTYEFMMTYAPLRTNGGYVQAEATAELNGYKCWGKGFHNNTYNTAGMNETKVTFPGGNTASQSVISSYASRMKLDGEIECSCSVAIIANQHPRMTEYCRSAVEASAVSAAGSGATLQGSKILFNKIVGNQNQTESYEVRTRQILPNDAVSNKKFVVVVSGEPTNPNGPNCVVQTIEEK